MKIAPHNAGFKEGGRHARLVGGSSSKSSGSVHHPRGSVVVQVALVHSQREVQWKILRAANADDS